MDTDVLTLGELNQFLFIGGLVVALALIVMVAAVSVSLWQERTIKKSIRRQNNVRNMRR